MDDHFIKYTDCIVDCSTSGEDCTSYIITATTALSLTIECSDTSQSYPRCDRMTVYCPYSTISTCRINCGSYQCYRTVINYPQPQNLYINCYGEQSCVYLQLLGPDTYSSATVSNTATILCYSSTYKGQCSYASFDISYVANANIKCSNIYRPYSSASNYYSACYQTTFRSNK